MRADACHTVVTSRLDLSLDCRNGPGMNQKQLTAQPFSPRVKARTVPHCKRQDHDRSDAAFSREMAGTGPRPPPLRGTPHPLEPSPRVARPNLCATSVRWALSVVQIACSRRTPWCAPLRMRSRLRRGADFACNREFEPVYCEPLSGTMTSRKTNGFSQQTSESFTFTRRLLS